MQLRTAEEACVKAADLLGLPASSLTARPIEGGWRVIGPSDPDTVGSTHIVLRNRDARPLRVSAVVSDAKATELLNGAPTTRVPAPKVLPANAIALGMLVQAIVLIGSLFLPQPYKAIGVGVAAAISVATARASMRRKRALATSAD